MKVIAEPGTLPQSECCFLTPSALAKQLFFYITRCGYTRCSDTFDFFDPCDVKKSINHKTFLLDYIQNGSMQIETREKIFTAEAGQVVLTACRQSHHFYSHGPLERIWLHFGGANSPELFRQILAFHGGKPVFTPFPKSQVKNSMEELISLIQHNSFTEAEISTRIYSLLCHLLLPPTVSSHEDSHPVNEALAYINHHLFEPISVQALSDQVGLSPSHFSRQFRNHTGVSPHEYIVLHRINEAKTLLHNTKLPIKEIAFRTGYRSDVNFITSFTSKVGLSPSTFRKFR